MSNKFLLYTFYFSTFSAFLCRARAHSMLDLANSQRYAVRWTTKSVGMSTMKNRPEQTTNRRKNDSRMKNVYRQLRYCFRSYLIETTSSDMQMCNFIMMWMGNQNAICPSAELFCVCFLLILLLCALQFEAVLRPLLFPSILLSYPRRTLSIIISPLLLVTFNDSQWSSRNAQRSVFFSRTQSFHYPLSARPEKWIHFLWEYFNILSARRREQKTRRSTTAAGEMRKNAANK